MFSNIKLKYFSQDLNREVVELYWQTMLSNLAVNLTYIFEPIFLYKLGYSVIAIMMFYVALYAAYALLVVPIAQITSPIGYKHSIFLSTLAYVAYWVVLYAIKFHPALFFVAPVLFAIQKCLYWPPYNAGIAINSIKEQRGREVGVLYSLVEIAAIAAPVLGGLISYTLGFPALFIIAGILLVSSVYPLFLSPEIYPRHEFRFKNFLSVIRQYPVNFFAYWGYAEDLMLMSLWPIYMFLLVPQVFSIGLIVTFASLIAIMVMLYLGKLLDNAKRNTILPVGAVLYGFTWVYRFIAKGFTGVVIFDVLTRLGKAVVNVPMLSTTFAIAGKRGPDFAIAYTVFYEFSLAVGKVFTGLLAALILIYGGSITDVFFAAGILTMCYGLLKK